MKKETEGWIKIAMEELHSAELLFEESIFRMVCYHCQQAVEKILKAILTENEVEIPRTHSLIDLNNAVKRFNYIPPLSDEDSIFLNSVYRARYPADIGLLPWGEPKNEDAQKALNISHSIFNWFKEIEPKL